MICEPWPQKLAPPTGYAAKWSLPFCLAARALRGPVGVELFEQPFDAEVLAFAQRIEWSAREDGFPDRYPGRVIVTLADGRSTESYVPDVLGAPDRPFPDELLVGKFRDAAAAVLPPADAAGLLKEVLALERAPSLSALGRYLRNAQASFHETAGEMEPA